MANRRMFSKKVIDTDFFLDMPATTQMLYFHLSLRGDDDGFISAPKRVMRMIGSSDDDMKLLVAKEFIIPFDSGVCVVKHWRIHNYIQKDRYQETFHKYEKSLIAADEGKENEYCLMDTGCIQDGYKMFPQVRLGKVRLGKDRLGQELETSHCDGDVLESDKEKEIEIDKMPYTAVVDYLNKKTNSNYRPTTKKNKQLIRARFNEGFSLEDFLSVIEKKTQEWQGTEMAKFLRPETLFGTKFEGYLNQPELKDKPKSVIPKSESKLTKRVPELN